jgi:hypothetical protein
VTISIITVRLGIAQMTKVNLEPAYFMVQLVVRGQKTPPKKILKPKTLSLLKKQANQAFKPEKPILSLLREDGTVVKELDNLESGTLLIASCRARRDGEDRQALTYEEIEELDFISRGHLQSQSFAAAFGRSRNGRRRSVSFAGSLGPAGLRDSDWGSGSRSRNAHDNRADSSWFEDASGRRRRRGAPLSELHIALNDLFGAANILPSLDEFIEASEKREFLLKLPSLEKAQSHAWFAAVVGAPQLAVLPRGAAVYDRVKRQATDVIMNHRFLVGKSVDHRLRLAIVGPRHSGKSVLLAELANQLAGEMAFSSEWKSSFIFTLDIRELVPHLNDYSQLLEIMADSVVDAAAGQRPTLLESLQSLKRKLTAPTKGGAIEPPASTRTPFDSIAKRLSDVWRDEDGFFKFFSLVFQLPVLVATAAGFENIVLIVDNVDHADRELAPGPPFRSQDTCLFMAEFVKCALDGVNFIVACEDTDRFLQIMSPIDEEGTDLLAGLHFASTLDVTNPSEDENRTERFAVDVDGDDLPLVLHIALCGGVVHFLEKWKILCNLMSRLDACPERGDQHDDVLFAAICAAQDFVSLVFNSEEQKDVIHVTNVTHLKEAKVF